MLHASCAVLDLCAIEAVTRIGLLAAAIPTVIDILACFLSCNIYATEYLGASVSMMLNGDANAIQRTTIGISVFATSFAIGGIFFVAAYSRARRNGDLRYGCLSR
jgi:hypothetical protein